jgi:hypothetical protein
LTWMTDLAMLHGDRRPHLQGCTSSRNRLRPFSMRRRRTIDCHTLRYGCMAAMNLAGCIIETIAPCSIRTLSVIRRYGMTVLIQARQAPHGWPAPCRMSRLTGPISIVPTTTATRPFKRPDARHRLHHHIACTPRKKSARRASLPTTASTNAP